MSDSFLKANTNNILIATKDECRHPSHVTDKAKEFTDSWYVNLTIHTSRLISFIYRASQVIAVYTTIIHFLRSQ